MKMFLPSFPLFVLNPSGGVCDKSIPKLHAAKITAFAASLKAVDSAPMVSHAPTVLITGANGFIGSRLCRSFEAAGFSVTAGVRKNADCSLLEGISLTYRYGDVTESASLPEMVRGADYIIHNAGLTKARTTEQFFSVNENGTRNLLEAAATHARGCKRFVLISSLAAGGPVRNSRPVAETDQPDPVTTYGKSKLAGERLVAAYADKLPITVVRPTGVYGPGDKEILTIFKTIAIHLRPQIGDQSRRIQLVHVDDLCDGVLAAATKEVTSGSVFYIAESRAYQMQELLDLVQRAVSTWTIPLPLPAGLFRMIAALSERATRLLGGTPMLTNEKANELLASWEVSTQAARERLGFEAAIPFADGAKQTVEWYRKAGWL